MALYRSPLTVTLWPSSFLKKYGPMIPPAHKAHQTVSFSGSARGLLTTDHVILNHGQVTWTTPELAPPLLTTTPHQREDVSALDRFNVHRCPTRRVFSGTGLEPVTKQATVRYLYHSATVASRMGREKTSDVWRVSRKKKLSLQDALDLLQNLPCKMRDALTDDSLDEDVPEDYLLELSLNS
ncbi:uncharacterized protein TNCV_3183951 [Trichonephila clavipes]|nr:uncharacterized protein TNCV_3183951 [Trichonephila clavipes]